MFSHPLSPRLLAYLIRVLLCLKTTCPFLYLQAPRLPHGAGGTVHWGLKPSSLVAPGLLEPQWPTRAL